ncbi:FecR domain-containing protein [Halobacteriovorax sp. YZS-1-1]|uniref:FecR domain-containing protein n=1 Tax=unclassified Halobacteriovorax TaxID=2639665 RepID=UPI00399AEC9D
MNKLKSSHFNAFEIMLAVSGSVLVLLGIYLSQNLSKVDQISSELIIVGDTTDGRAKRKTERSFSWSEINNQETVFNNDQIFTSSNQTLNILLENKSSLEINPNSLVRVVINESKGLDLNIDQGTLKVDASETKQVLRINRGNSVVEVAKGGVVKLEKLNEENYGVKLLKGEASVINLLDEHKAKLDLKEGESTLVNSNSPSFTPEGISLAEGERLVATPKIKREEKKTIELNEKFDIGKVKQVYVKAVNDSAQPFVIYVKNKGFNVSLLKASKYFVSTSPDFQTIDSFEITASKVKAETISIIKSNEVDISKNDRVKLDESLISQNISEVYLKPSGQRTNVIKLKVTDGSFITTPLAAGKYLISTSPGFEKVDSFKVIGAKDKIDRRSLFVDDEINLADTKKVSLNPNLMTSEKIPDEIYIRSVNNSEAPLKIKVEDGLVNLSQLAVGSYIVSPSPNFQSMEVINVNNNVANQKIVTQDIVDTKKSTKVELNDISQIQKPTHVFVKPANSNLAPIKLNVIENKFDITTLASGKYIVATTQAFKAIDSFDILPSNDDIGSRVKETQQYTSFLETDEVDLLTQDKVTLKKKSTQLDSSHIYLKSTSLGSDVLTKISKLPITNGSFDISSLSFGKYIVSTSPDFSEFDSLDVVANKMDPIALKSKTIDYEKPVEVKLNIRKGIKSKVIVEYPDIKKKTEYVVSDNDFSFPSFDQENINVTVLPLVSVGAASVIPNISTANTSPNAKSISSNLAYEKKLNLKLENPYQLKEIKSKSLEDKIVTSININRPLIAPSHTVKLVEKASGALVPLSVGKDGGFESTNLKSGKYNLAVVNEESKVRLLSKEIKIDEAVLIKKKTVKNKQNVIVSSFSWDSPDTSSKPLEQSENKESYIVEVFDTANSLIMKKEVKQNSIDFESKDMSDYKIKVSKIEEGKKKALGEKEFKVKPPKNINPEEVKKYVMKYDSKNLCYRVTLPSYLTASKYFVEIYRDVQMTKIVREIWSNSSSFCWRSNRDGKYFFRYKYIDYWGSGSKYSDISEIIFPISPLTDF